MSSVAKVDPAASCIFEPLPRAELNSEGTLVLPLPFPPRVGQETEMSCGEGCIYHVRNVAFQPIDDVLFAPGGVLEDTFQPADDIPLMSKDEFMARHRIAPPVLTPFGVLDEH